MSTARRIVEGMTFPSALASMVEALRDLEEIANPSARFRAYARAGITGLEGPCFAAADQSAVHLELTRRAKNKEPDNAA